MSEPGEIVEERSTGRPTFGPADVLNAERLTDPCGHCHPCKLVADQGTTTCVNQSHAFDYWNGLDNTDIAMELQSQCASDLVTGIIRHCLGKTTTPQLNAQIELGAWVAEERRRWMTGKRDFRLEEMTRAFSLFDMIFFRGLITASDRVTLLHENVYARQGTAVAYIETPGRQFPGFAVKLTMKRFRPENDSDCRNGHALQQYLSFLLHEMTHAVLDLFLCICRPCKCLKNVMRTTGLTGHGPSYCRLRQAIEIRANQTMRTWFIAPWVVTKPSGIDHERRREHEENNRLIASGELEGALNL